MTPSVVHVYTNLTTPGSECAALRVGARGVQARRHHDTHAARGGAGQVEVS